MCQKLVEMIPLTTNPKNAHEFDRSGRLYFRWRKLGELADGRGNGFDK